MKTLSTSILILALAIGYTGYSFSDRPIVQHVTEVVEITPNDEQLEEYMDDQEGLWYGIDSELAESAITQGI